MAIRVVWSWAGANPTLFVNGSAFGFVCREASNSFIAYDSDGGYLGKSNDIQIAKRIVEHDAKRVGAELAEYRQECELPAKSEPRGIGDLGLS